MLKPLADRVLVKVEEEETKTMGGILLPDTAQKKSQKGVVVAVGSGKMTEEGKRLPLEVKEGDEVLFAKYSGTEIEDKGEKYLLLSERDILAIL
ncbi:co-chaperone GroES [Allisonella histaminiformans]|uniref:Co-chaperonin GroES n=1 Tax=Allisonella histaminiformans TaxID=209880 RepID=A0A1G5UU75_9FIRM|nr:co-chaperone GroES [Allisonella histaminiformans]PWL44558.1 MAG: co-chaperone GroES [Veillonellaceae bacterium]MCI6003386.1 co-chaperone GroES [Allisonella histaminiformans]MDD6870627.1 co-chaperone GroES [Allisonella histaminiformans]MDY3957562.1 co-chaperone GroES [Allisonella histaminiformans]MDY4540431.1 co-chaperone GroES [Allisonella histaminiformans]